MILLSFDIEEFDMPFEYDRSLSFEEQMQLSIEGTEKIIDLLTKHQIKATFFVTANFAVHAENLVRKIVDLGHEIASHGYYHTEFSLEHLLQSREKLEEISGQKVKGYRMPRMKPVDEKAIAQAGYLYNSSINPTYLPGRYNNLHIKRTHFYKENVLQLPASVTPWFRIPLFWLSFHNFPLFLYKYLSNKTLKHDHYLNIYFHPWEFLNLDQPKKFNFPSYVVRNSGNKMYSRLDDFILHFKQKNVVFGTISDYLQTKSLLK